VGKVSSHWLFVVAGVVAAGVLRSAVLSEPLLAAFMGGVGVLVVGLLYFWKQAKSGNG
jgi:hypothetical protein